MKYRKIRNKLVKKYDKNKDGLISIDEYLANEISRGPKAKQGDIGYHYQHLDNIYQYFTIISLKKIKTFKVMCIPKFKVRYNKFQDRTTAVFDVTNGKYYFPKSMRSAVNKCKKEGIRLIYFTLSLKIDKTWFMHANMVILDLKNNTIERFEPHGCANFYKNKVVDDFFKKHVLKFLGFKKYISPVNVSGKVGIQRKSDAYGGMCVTISMMYLQMRIMNLDVKQKKLVKYFLKMSKKNLKSVILKFARYVEKTLKSHNIE